MQRFLFRVSDGGRDPDEVWVRLGDLAAARTEAARMMGHLLAHNAEEFWAKPSWRVEVSGEDGAVVFSLLIACRDEASPTA